ncbi:MAG: hypothetical protein ACK5HT_04420, partial [Draconibacterium sp.]
TICEGESISIGDWTYSETGIYTQTLSNQFGCDSVVTLHLTVNPVQYADRSETICQGESIEI